MAHPAIKIAGLAYSAYEYLKDAKKAYAPEKKKKPKNTKTAINTAIKQKAIEPKAEPEDKPGYFGRLKKGLSNMMRNYLDSDK